jgi:hypothetical protein
MPFKSSFEVFRLRASFEDSLWALWVLETHWSGRLDVEPVIVLIVLD